MVYWQVGFKINTYIFECDRGAYGKTVVADISDQLTPKYDKSFDLRNLRRIRQFAEVFSEFEIVWPVAAQLSWSHFIELLSIKSSEARMLYARKNAEETWSKQTLKRLKQPSQ
ncbi:DUF1016 N-terminal domain-containing protein [Algoriphagus sp. AGSA1]|nr:DUF1016 N-terminal domain-containing protein [Algoriphagus sp. AGSA1]